MADFDELVSALTSGDRDTRVRAACELGHARTAAAAEALIETFQTADRGLQVVIEDALVDIGPPAIPPLVVAIRSGEGLVQWRMARVLGRIADPATGPLFLEIFLSQAAAEGAREEAAEALGRIGHRAAMGSLAAQCRRGGNLAASAVRSLAELVQPGDDDEIDLLRQAAAVPEALDAKVAAARAWIRIGNVDEGVALCTSLVGRHGFARIGLKQFGPKASAALPAILDAIQKTAVFESTERREYAELLGAIGPAAKAALPVLQELTRDKHEPVANAAREAIERIGPIAEGPPTRPVLAPSLGLLRPASVRRRPWWKFW